MDGAYGVAEDGSRGKMGEDGGCRGWVGDEWFWGMMNWRERWEVM